MGKYKDLAGIIIENVGGKENIGALTHCVTRLRFNLKDESKANTDVLKNTKGVVTVMKTAGQYQVVIGNQVQDVYAEIVEQAGIADGAPAEKKKLSAGAAVLDFITGVFGPIISILCAGGMIKGFLSLFVFLGWMSETQGLYQILYACGDALFYFFPVLLGFSCFKKLGGKPYLGALIGAAMMYPTIQGVDLNVFGMTINVTYTSTVLPIIFTSLLGAWMQKKLDKVIPDVVKGFMTPMLVMIICVPLGFCFIGVVANTISNWISSGIMTAYGVSPILAGILMAGLWQILVIFGVHQGLVAVLISSLATVGFSPIGSLYMPGSFAQTAVVFAIWLRTKDENLKDNALPAWISGIFGVTEPAIYGITLPRIKYFAISCIGAAVGGAWIGASGVVMKIMGGMGVFAFPSFYAQGISDGNNIVIGCAIAALVSFVATFFLYKDDKQAEQIDEEEFGKTAAAGAAAGENLVGTIEIDAPAAGEVIDLADVPDEVFAGGALGKGCAIRPTEGEVYAPADGVVTTLFPTLHAIGITTPEGAEILVHIGINTVELNGKYFKAHIKQGDTVKKGQKLVSVDLDAVKKAGYPIETPVIITNTPAYLDIVEETKGPVRAGDKIITIIR
ncbi:MAG: beta-glucoside-specific PTS transporter subunit IIABC [Eubacteriaceae bacterium]|jgi:PTS system beta-glucosides-specific IIC component